MYLFIVVLITNFCSLCARQSGSEFEDLVDITAEEACMLELAATQHDPAHQPPPKRRRPSASQSIDDEEAMIMEEYSSLCMDIPEEYLVAQPKSKPRECERVMSQMCSI